MEAAGIECAIGGALALAYWGTPRATKDVDLTVFVQPREHQTLFDVLEGVGCEFDRASAVALAADEELVVVYHSGIRVDLFVPSIPFYDAARERVVRVPLHGGLVPVLSAETLCVFKLLFFRSKDLVDLEHIIALQGADLDTQWVRGWVVDMVGEDDGRAAAWDRLVATHGS